MNPHIKVGWSAHYLCSYIFSLLQYKENLYHTSDGGDSRRILVLVD